MDTNLIRPFVVLLCAFFAVQNTSAQNPDNGVLATPLEQYRHNYQQFSLTDYYAGGEKSRFAWQSLPGLFRHATISHTQVKPIDYAPDNGFANRAIRVNKESMSFDGYVKGDERIDSIMVLHHGKLVYQYFKHHRPHDRHIMWSVTKVITAAALAILESKGLVDMQAQVKQYIPELNRSGWSDIKVQDVVDMASGIDCNDSDTRPDSCYSRIDVSFDLAPAAKGQESTMDIFNQMTKQRAPGERTEYNSANTIIVGKIVENVTQLPLHEAIAHLLWRPMGAEADGMMLVNRTGEAYAGGGISARLLDLARFGLLYTTSDTNNILSESHKKALSQHARPLFSEQMQAGLMGLFNGDVPLHSRWQWDLIWQDGDMYKDGFSGQGLYISPKNDWVMVWYGTADKQFRKHFLLPIARQISSTMIVDSAQNP